MKNTREKNSNEEHHHTQGKPHSKFLRSHRKNKIRVRFGKEIDLLPTLPQADASGTARSNSKKRLPILITCAVAIRFRIKKRHDTTEAAWVIAPHQSNTHPRQPERLPQ